MHMLMHVAPAYGQFRLAHIGLAFARLARRHRAKAQHRCRIDEPAMLAATGQPRVHVHWQMVSWRPRMCLSVFVLHVFVRARVVS